MSFQCYESFVHSNALSIDASNPKGSDTYSCERNLYFFSGSGTVPLEIARDMHFQPMGEMKINLEERVGIFVKSKMKFNLKEKYLLKRKNSTPGGTRTHNL